MRQSQRWLGFLVTAGRLAELLRQLLGVRAVLQAAGRRGALSGGRFVLLLVSAGGFGVRQLVVGGQQVGGVVEPAASATLLELELLLEAGRLVGDAHERSGFVLGGGAALLAELGLVGQFAADVRSQLAAVRQAAAGGQAAAGAGHSYASARPSWGFLSRLSVSVLGSWARAGRALRRRCGLGGQPVLPQGLGHAAAVGGLGRMVAVVFTALCGWQAVPVHGLVSKGGQKADVDTRSRFEHAGHVSAG